MTKQSAHAGAEPIAGLTVALLRGVEATVGGPPRARAAGGLPGPDRSGQPVEISGRRLRALLALLALTPGVARRADYLADQLWDGRPPSANALQALVSRLRRVLGADAVVSRPTGYALAVDPEAVDLVRFDRLVRQGTGPAARQALALAGPEPLAEFADVPDLADEARRIEADCWRLRDLVQSEPDPAPADAAPAAGIRTGPAPRRLIGRDRLLDELGGRLAATRLLTLVGAGGAGKTSLARHLAYRCEQAAFVELAPVSAPDVAEEALVAVGGREVVLSELTWTAPDGVDGREPAGARERLAALIGTRPLLLVLDNCEHVISAAADLAAYLLDRCAALTILATSREPLAIPGELREPVDPLVVPPAGSAAEELACFSAMELLIERGRAVRPGVSGAGEEGAALAEICRRLDGIPLALELAAARFNSLSPRQVADRLDDRFSLLTNGMRTALPRQQTLRAVVDWSWDLLDQAERELLTVGAVFLGGATFEDLEAVSGTAILDPLDRLVAKSLVVAEDRGGRMRYRLLETIREYALERLAAAGLVDAVRARHAEHFAQLAKKADPQLRGPDQMTWLARLDMEQDNIRAALAATLDLGLLQTALTICGRMAWYSQLRGQTDLHGLTTRAVAMVERLPDPEPTEDLGRAFMLNAMLGLDSGMSTEDAGAMLGRARKIYQELGEYHTVSIALDIAWAMFHAESFPEVLARSDAACAAAGDDWGQAVIRMIWVRVAADEDVDRAEELGRSSVELFGRCGDRWGLANGGQALGLVESIRGRHEAAIEALAEALAHARTLGAVDDQAQVMAQIACEYEYLGDPGRADELLQETEEFLSASGHRMPRSMPTYLHVLSAQLYLQRGDLAGAEAALELGRELVNDGHSFGFRVQLDTLAGLLAAEAGDHPAALDFFARVVEEGSKFLFDPSDLADSLEGIANVAVRTGQPALAARLFGAALGMRPAQAARSRVRRTAAEVEAAVRAALPPDQVEAAFAEGAALTGTKAAEFAAAAIAQLRG
ncbi:MAG TPA: winged helix-turn-helix domain-containing protein [Actinocrinis sp.]|nr:winged helix-turn-helix domain-containing protein [Actinocrinis sp.]